MTDGNRLRSRADAEEELLRLVIGAPNYVLNSGAVIHADWNSLDNAKLLSLG